MRTHVSLLAAACIAAAGLAIAPSFAADTPRSYTTNTAQLKAEVPNLPPGVKPKEMSERDSIQNAFESVTESAFNTKGFPDVIDNLADQDRTRVQHEANGSPSQPDDPLTRKIGEVKTEWQNKYHKQFDIKNDKVYDNFIQFKTGEIDNPQELVGKWPLMVSPNDSNRGGEASEKDIKDATNHAFGGDVNLGKGRDVAVAVLPGKGEIPSLTLSMIHEAGGWKFDIPNNITRQQLHDALLANLSYLSDHKDNWSNDETEAYRAATRCVVAALYNVNVENLTHNGQAARHEGMNNANRTAGER